jgi:hypothetical protein
VKLKVDLRDGHVYGGLLLAMIGGCAISWSWTLVTLGLVVSALGVFAPRFAAAASASEDLGVRSVSTRNPAEAVREAQAQLRAMGV